MLFQIIKSIFEQKRKPEIPSVEMQGDIIYPIEKFKNDTIEFDSDKCNLCLECLKTCPKKAISFIDGKISISEDKCNKCGKCIEICKTKAISLDSDYDFLFASENDDNGITIIESDK